MAPEVAAVDGTAVPATVAAVDARTVGADVIGDAEDTGKVEDTSETIDNIEDD